MTGRSASVAHGHGPNITEAEHCPVCIARGSASPLARTEGRSEIFVAIIDELNRAYAKHGALPWGRHEWYAITLEELEEAWDAIKGDRPAPELRAEIIQVAAMCVRFLETGDRYERWGAQKETNG